MKPWFTWYGARHTQNTPPINLRTYKELSHHPGLLGISIALLVLGGVCIALYPSSFLKLYAIPLFVFGLVGTSAEVYILIGISLSRRAAHRSDRTSVSNSIHTLITISVDQRDLDLPPRVNIDDVVFDRISEYKQCYPDQACVLLITEALPPKNSADSNLYSILNGPVAAMSIARAIASSHRLSTLLIDTGSRAWSDRKHAAYPSDIFALPEVPGFYDVIEKKLLVEDCLLFEEETYDLSALASGKIPWKWQDALVSPRSLDLIRQARSLADLVLIYAPRCNEHPAVIENLAALSDGVMIVSGVDDDAEKIETQAIAVLQSANALVLGRIALSVSEMSWDTGNLDKTLTSRAHLTELTEMRANLRSA